MTVLMAACVSSVALFTCVWILVLASKDPQELKAKPGEDVTLLCEGPREAAVRLLKWNRPDLESDGYVLFHRDGKSLENYQHPSFHGRVDLRDPKMQDGEFTVFLKNVDISDTGTYECYVGDEGEPQLIKTTTLTVSDSGDAAGQTRDGEKTDETSNDDGKKDGGHDIKEHLGLYTVVWLFTCVLLIFCLRCVGFKMFKKPQRLRE
ncbi:uncharacterized protein LOC113168125 [Anabas testudineus]|uniref:uncharacterized protein LOC113168125 n=1 Tax=Anabas testudineus TaxID=64144 RepID=UPI000E45B059|nr:uncharacterized protein LOC113168125 [Anabas testudineus]